MKAPIFTGAATAIVTPFTADGTQVDFLKLEQLLDFQINNGISAIVVCGTTGEASTQTTQEHMKTVEHTIGYVAGRVPCIAGTSSNDTAHAVEMSVEAARLGADALLVATPYYNKTTQAGLVKHYTMIADAAKLPVILYNVPSRTGLGFTADTYYELSKHPLMNGVKEAGSNTTLVLNTMYRVGDDLNFWSGNDDQIVPLMAMGAKGVISVLANAAPAATADICKLFLEGNITGSAQLLIKYSKLIELLFCEVNPIPVKAAMKLIGMDMGPLRMPLVEMTEKNLALLAAEMKSLGMI
ncbi:MAG: 4-hydroxy-tetrahydrodipicolinate synthase [Oscillospiraceae bacterium]|nr:4-hydroxy-tetrahydrodipicolinate synthase [Oscillospiraceae bacterium]